MYNNITFYKPICLIIILNKIKICTINIIIDDDSSYIVELQLINSYLDVFCIY